MSEATLDLQPTLIGERITLRPIKVTDFKPLFEAAKDPLIWEQHPSPLRYQLEVFKKELFDTGIESKTTLVVIDNHTSSIIGSSRFYDVQTLKYELAIGFTFLTRSHWGGSFNNEMKTLMLKHAFTWAEKVWFHVGKDNHRSRKALDKIGAKLSHIEPRVINGSTIDHCFYYVNK